MEKIEHDKKVKLNYCIPNWIRDDQIRYSTNLIKGRIKPVYEKRDEDIALVAFGPSLNDTWEKIKNFKYVMTCSGSHKFLIEKGIIPTHHIEVDPRIHKIELLGTPDKRVEYIISSACHPEYFKWLLKHEVDINLWHVFDNYDEGFRLLPRGEWSLTGGASVGLRMLSIARFLGFCNFHVFGMDGNKRGDNTHASDHPNAPKVMFFTEYKGKEYITTPSMLEVARQTIEQLDLIKDIKVTFYGEGLIQEMAKDWIPDTTKEKAPIGFNKPYLISDMHRDRNRRLHESNLMYGVSAEKHYEDILNFYKAVEATSLLDYGAGKGYLGKHLPFPIWEYDPAIPGKDEEARPADVVTCIDVLEHIEPDYLGLVLNDLQRCIKKYGYFIISTIKAVKTFDDNVNTHLIVENKQWWEKMLSDFFIIDSIIEKDTMLLAIVKPLTDNKNDNKEDRQHNEDTTGISE